MWAHGTEGGFDALKQLGLVGFGHLEEFYTGVTRISDKGLMECGVRSADFEYVSPHAAFCYSGVCTLRVRFN
jgi:hypothetical protein